jgi:hypothetical protein
MKTLFTILILCLAFNVFGQPDTKSLYQDKIQSYKSLERTGTGLAILGFVATACGGYTYTKGINNMKYEGTMVQGTTQYGMGVGLMLAGASIFVTGAILGNIGNTKVKYYQKKVDIGLSVGKVNGMSLCYRF